MMAVGQSELVERLQPDIGLVNKCAGRERGIYRLGTYQAARQRGEFAINSLEQQVLSLLVSSPREPQQASEFPGVHDCSLATIIHSRGILPPGRGRRRGI